MNNYCIINASVVVVVVARAGGADSTVLFRFLLIFFFTCTLDPAIALDHALSVIMETSVGSNFASWVKVRK